MMIAGRYQALSCIACGCAWALLVGASAEAGASGWSSTLGVDYRYGEYTLRGQQHSVTLQPQGPGVSYTLGGDGPWSASVSYSTQRDGTTLGFGSLDLDYEADGLGIQFSGSWLVGEQSRWLTVFWQRDEETLTLVDLVEVEGSPRREFREETVTDSLGLELGLAWDYLDWSPSLAVALTGLRSDTDRDLQASPESGDFLVAIRDEDTLDGLDGSVAVRLDYYHLTAARNLLVPSVGVTYQRSLSGDITGSSTTSVIGRQGRRTFTSGSTQALDGGDQVVVDLGASLLLDDWHLQLAYSRPVLEAPRDELWVAGLGYRF